MVINSMYTNISKAILRQTTGWSSPQLGVYAGLEGELGDPTRGRKYEMWTPSSACFIKHPTMESWHITVCVSGPLNIIQMDEGLTDQLMNHTMNFRSFHFSGYNVFMLRFLRFLGLMLRSDWSETGSTSLLWLPTNVTILIITRNLQKRLERFRYPSYTVFS